MDAGLAPMLFVLVVSLTGVESHLIKGPANALKKAGDSVMLECVTDSKNCDQVDWVKMEGAQSPKTVYTRGIMLDTFPRERYSINSTGGCNLTITQLNINDSGRFTCSQLIGDKQETRGCILFVIAVTESCISNVTNGALNHNESYSFSTAINVPPKSVEPSNVALSFQNKTADETETPSDSQSQTINTTLTGIAKRENIMPRVCWASLPPNTVNGFDNTTATLVVCTTQQLIVSYPVENIAVSPSSGPYYKGATVRCTADGHPYPTFKWIHLISGAVVADGDTLVINGEAGDQYTCTATNIIDGKVESQIVTIEVSPDSSCGSDCIRGIITMFIIVIIIIIILVVVWFVCWRRKQWPLMLRIPFLSKKDDKTRRPKKEKTGEPLPDLTHINEPAEPPRATDPAPVDLHNRPPSECNYAELQFEPKPQQIKPNPVNDSSTDYASVAIA